MTELTIKFDIERFDLCKFYNYLLCIFFGALPQSLNTSINASPQLGPLAETEYICSRYIKKQPTRGVLRKRCSDNIP